MRPTIKTTAVFFKPFELLSFDEVLPAGEYEIETELLEPVDWIRPGSWTRSVLVHLHPRASHPGLSRTLSVPLAELELAIAKDKPTGKTLTDYFLEEMLADSMIRLVMQADGVSASEIQRLHAGRVGKDPIPDKPTGGHPTPADGKGREVKAPRRLPSRPGIGE